MIRARSAPLSPASGFPVSWSQQVIREMSGLRITGWSSAMRGILEYFPGLHLDLGNRNAGRGGCE